MACYDCEHLDPSNKKDGHISGSVYYCSKTKQYVNGVSDGCDAYSKGYKRST